MGDGIAWFLGEDTCHNSTHIVMPGGGYPWLDIFPSMLRGGRSVGARAKEASQAFGQNALCGGASAFLCACSRPFFRRNHIQLFGHLLHDIKLKYTGNLVGRPQRSIFVHLAYQPTAKERVFESVSAILAMVVSRRTHLPFGVLPAHPQCTRRIPSQRWTSCEGLPFPV